MGYIYFCISQFLRRVSKFVDNALKSATEARKETSNKADKQFKMAVKVLEEREMLQKGWSKQTRPDTVAHTMAVVEAMDKSASTILNKLREKLRVRGELHVTFAFTY